MNTASACGVIVVLTWRAGPGARVCSGLKPPSGVTWIGGHVAQLHTTQQGGLLSQAVVVGGKQGAAACVWGGVGCRVWGVSGEGVQAGQGRALEFVSGDPK